MYCFTKEFLGTVSISMSAFSSKSSNEASIGNLPINSGISPNFNKSSGSTPDNISEKFLVSGILTLTLNPIPAVATAGIGFSVNVKMPETRNFSEILSGVEPEDLLKFGLIPEFIGRLPILASLDDLDEKALIEILTVPKNSLVKQYKKIYSLEDVKLYIF